MPHDICAIHDTLGIEIAMQVRPYRAEDEVEIIALWEACGLTHPWNSARKNIARDDVISMGNRLEHDD